VSVALTYFVSVLIGLVMVHTGSPFALKHRDELVGKANRESSIRQAANRGDNLRAALLDFMGNLVMGSVPESVSGFAIVFPYPMVAYQGWVGGIVSVRDDRTSRLNTVRSALYYLITLVMQLSAYSLAIGAGVNAGISLFRPAEYYRDQKLFRLFSKEVLRDFGRLYALAAPLFLLASLWEFLSPWNI
jgi:uncharacterized membrane protein SpoIIM required for sporulation